MSIFVFWDPITLMHYFDVGTVRHLKYFSELFYMPFVSIKEFIFGYGYRGTGDFFLYHRNWLRILQNFLLGNGKIPESTLTNLMLYGGLLGMIYNIFIYTFVIYKEKRFKKVLFILVLLYAGYTFENVWTILFVYFLIFYNLLKDNETNSKVEVTI